MTDALNRVRSLCLALPEAWEKVSHGEPSWFAGRGKQFASFAMHHHDDRIALWLAAPDGTQSSLVARSPERFFVPPYVGGRGWIGVYLDITTIDWAELEDLIEDSFRQVATKKLVAALAQPDPAPDSD